MKNINEIINMLKNHEMFVIMDKKSLLKLKKKKVIAGYRNDGTGSRLMAYVNLVRIAKKLKKNFVFYWDTRADKYSDAWPHNKIASDDISKYLPNIKNISLYNSNSFKISEPNINEWKFLLFENENKKKVVKECKKILSSILKNYKKENQKIKKMYEFGLHVRCGGLNATTGRITHITNIHFYKENFNLGKWYPEAMWIEILNKIKKKSIIVSDDYRHIKKKLKPGRNFTFNKYKKNSSELNKFLQDIFVVSNADKVICSVKSGAGLIIMLTSKNFFFTPESYLQIDKIYFSFSKIIEKYFYKFNTLNSLIDHNLKYFGSKPIDILVKIKEITKKKL